MEAEGLLSASDEAGTPVDRLRRRGWRNVSQDDSGVEINQREGNGRNPKRRDGSPKVESPPKKARRSLKRVIKDGAEAEKAGGRKTSAKRSALVCKAIKDKKPTRKKNVTKNEPSDKFTEPLTTENRKMRTQTDAKLSGRDHATAVFMSESNRRPSRNRANKSLKDILDDDITDDDDDEDVYALKKRKNRNRALQEKGTKLSIPETSDSGAETEKPKKKRAPKSVKKSTRLKKTFTKPRRPDQNRPPAIEKNNVLGSSGVISSSYEQRLLLLARQIDGTACSSGQSNNNNQEAKQTLDTNVAMEDATREKARREFIIEMLKEHEEVAKMSDDSDYDCDAKTVENKSKIKTPTMDHTIILPEVRKDLKTKDVSRGKQTKASKRKGAPAKVNIPKHGKQSDPPGNTDKSSSSEDEDWEVVQNADEQNPNYQRPGEVTVVLKNEDVLPDAKRLNMEQRIMRLINRRRKTVQHLSHQTHLLCLLAYQRYINSIVQNDTLKALSLSCMPDDLVLKSSLLHGGADSYFIESILFFCKGTFELTESNRAEPFSVKYLKDKLRVAVTKKITGCNIVYLLAIVLIMRSMGIPTRLCFSHRPISHKAKLLRRKHGAT
ncbi:DNA repair protein rhp42-like, partial [Tropilaelaps mercedesae]